MPPHKKLRYFGFTLLTAHLVSMGYFWWQGSGQMLLFDLEGAMLAIGRLMGLILATLVLTQFTLMSRALWLEPAWGLDRISRLHHQIGKYILIPLLLHPALILLVNARINSQSIWQEISGSIFNYIPLTLALASWSLFLFIISYSLLMLWRKWEFEKWYLAHLLVYIAVALGFLHQIQFGGEFLGSETYLKYWLTFFCLVFLNLIYFRILRPLILFLSHRYTVSKVVQETPDVVSITVTGKNLHELHTTPGQFFIWRFLAKGFTLQAHPFSVSTPQPENALRLSVKAVGDFTKTLPLLPLGTKVVLEGPFGVFTPARSKNNRLLLISGGIGITPLRAMLDTFLQEGRDVVFLCCNKTQSDMVFKDELRDLATKYKNLTLHHILSQDPQWTGESGTLDQEKLKRLVPQLTERDVYLCGPPPMMSAVKAQLQMLGMASKNIFTEEFSL